MGRPESPSGVRASSPHMTTICFTTQDLAQFSTASGDRNPLHVSEQYARASPYGEPVVFGMLGVLAILGHFPDRPKQRLRHLSVEFRNPLTVGVPYRVEIVEPSGDRAVAKLYDAARLMLKASMTFAPDHQARHETADQDAAGLTEAADRTKAHLGAGTHVSGRYAPSIKELRQLADRWKLFEKGATLTDVSAMMWVSYAVGMELPGKRAVFWRLELTLPADGEMGPPPLTYELTVQSYDERLDLLHTTGTLSVGASACATTEMWAFVREDSPRPSLHRLTNLLPRSNRLKDKVALVIGGSRGLGAAITQALASQGCTVFLNYLHCGGEAEQIRTSLGDASGLIELTQGDASDIDWCRTLQQHIVERHGGLDILICNASPPIRPLPFVPEKVAQFQTFLAQSVALVSMPMSTFLSDLAQRSGWNVLISSAFVRDLPADWPHYATAKCALEGLAQWAAIQNPTVHSLIVRPPKLLTDQTNTTVGRHGAMEIERAAAAIVQQLTCPDRSPNMHILDTF